MAGTLPILKIRSSNFLVGLLTAIPMTCYNERKIFKILKFLTHPIIHPSIITPTPEIWRPWVTLAT